MHQKLKACCKDLQQTLLSTNVKFELKQKECNDEHKQKNKLSQEIFLLKDEIEKYNLEISDLKLKVDYFLNKERELDNITKNLHNKNLNIEQSYENAMKSLAKQEYEIKLFEKELLCANDLRKQLEADNQKLYIGKLQLEEENSKLQNEIKALSETNDLKEKKNVCLEHEHHDLFEDTKRLEHRFHQSSDLIEKLNKLSEELHFENVQKSLLIKQLEASNTSLQQSLSNLQNEKKVLITNLSDFKLYIQKEENNKNRLQESLKNQIKLCENMKQKVSSLKRDLKVSMDEIGNLKVNFQNDISEMESKCMDQFMLIKNMNEKQIQDIKNYFLKHQKDLDFEHKNNITFIIQQKGKEIHALKELIKINECKFNDTAKQYERDICKLKSEKHNIILAAQQDAKKLNEKINELNSIVKAEHESHSKHLQSILIKFQHQESKLATLEKEYGCFREKSSEEKNVLENQIIQVQRENQIHLENLKAIEANLEEASSQLRFEADKNAELYKNQKDLLQKYEEGKITGKKYFAENY